MSVLWPLFLPLLAWPLTGKAQFFSYPFYYTTNNNAVIITGYAGTGNSLTIPSTLNGLPVTIIGVNAFYYWFNPDVQRLTNVLIPNSVLSIEANAFTCCSNLLNVTLGNSVTNLGDGAFANCSRLRSAAVPANTIYLGASAFANCTSLTNVTLPSALLSIGAGAFDNCQSLTGITVDPGNSMFSSLDGVLFNKPTTLLLFCPNGKTGAFTIPYGTTAINDAAFQNCVALTSVMIPDTVTNTGSSTFQNCTGLTSATLGTGVLNIGASAFYSCSSLVRVTLPPTILGIGDSAFQYCGGLTNFVMPNTVTNTGNHTFSDCTNLVSAKLSTNLTILGNFLFWNCHSLSDVTIPPGVIIIGAGTFGNGTALKSLIIPDSVQNIGDYAFNACSLGYLQMGASVTNIGQRAFLGCSGVTTTVTMPKGLLYIGDYGFAVCWRVPAIFFQGDAPTLGGSALWDDLAATAYYLPGTHGWSNSLGDISAVLWNPLMQLTNAAAGASTKPFGFNVTGTANIPIVLEVSTNLGNGTWATLLSGVVTNGSFYFSDPKSTNFSRRFYRIRSP